MSGISDRELIDKALSVVHVRKKKDSTVGGVGCALPRLYLKVSEE